MNLTGVLRSYAPGKIILTGEHAAVYGRPALATAVSKGVEATVSTMPEPMVQVSLSGMSETAARPVKELESLRLDRPRRLDAFRNGTLPISQVVDSPLDLLLFNVAQVYHEMSKPVETGMDIELRSDIPLGSGMGSSAAAAAALLAAGKALLKHPWNRSRLEELTSCSEALQHGRPSGVDAAVCVQGGLIRYTPDERRTLNATLPSGWLAFTGVPEASTGECVDDVRRRVSDPSMWDHFADCTIRLESSLLEEDAPGWRDGIRENHRLLCEIGVVPEPVQTFIRSIEDQGGAAKISGAGSVRGTGAGMVLIFGEQDFTHLCQEAGYSVLPLEGGADGVHLL